LANQIFIPARSGKPNFLVHVNYNFLEKLKMATLDGESKCRSGRLPVEMTQENNKKQRVESAIALGEAVSVKTASSGSRKKTVIRKEHVERVRNRLEEIWNDAPENAPFTDQDGEPLWGPVVLFEKITWEVFNRWLDAFEGDVRRWIFEPHEVDKKCGRVVIYSFPKTIHERTAGKILTGIQEEVVNAGNSRLLRTLNVAASPTCKLGNQRGKEPDMSITPAGLAIGGDILDIGEGVPFPNIIIEVAYKNEPLDPHRESRSVGFRDVIRHWLSPQTSVQVVIGIKIFERQDRRYRAILAVRNAPVWQEVEFGNVNRSGRPIGPGPITLEFPLALLYHGVALPSALEDLDHPTITIDLIALRDYLNTLPLA
jgi:hypothetical protein